MASPEQTQPVSDVEQILNSFTVCRLRLGETAAQLVIAQQAHQQAIADSIEVSTLLRWHGIEPAAILERPMPEHLAGPGDPPMHLQSVS